ncbi:hypothetical protein [Macrococcus animalis]|uniref:hypothetical protein n=1 Tax=Macrococcus animalis TaxID=3395467 RepID=UPI0039BEB26C
MKLQLTSIFLAFVSFSLWQLVALFIRTDNGLIFGMTFITWLLLLSVYMVREEMKEEVR